MLAKLSTRPPARRPAVRSAFPGCAAAGAVGLVLLGAGLTATGRSNADLDRFYDQEITWSACEAMDLPKDLQCGSITVPLDYAHPEKGTLELALARYRASDEPRGSVLLNFGGPGGSGVLGLAHGRKDFLGLTDDYDVVSFDPRGVGRSSPVSCGADATGQALEATDGEEMSDPRETLRQLREVAVECAEHSGPVLDHIGTVNVAQDLDVMRQVLGDKKLNYLGFSYGTRLGAVYAARFPDRVGRMALDGVDTLTEPLAEQGLASARGQQRALENFLTWCTEELSCPFGQDPRDARVQVVDLVESLDENPVPTDFGYEFTGQDLAGAIGQGLYTQEMWPLLQRALAQLMEDGDTSGVEALAGGGMLPVPQRADDPLVDEEDVPLDNLPAALMAVNCADDPDRPAAGRLTRDLARLRTAYAEASPVFGRYRLAQVVLCYGRPKGTDYIRKRVKDLDTPKMLLVGTRGDPATPYRWTIETAERLGSSAVVLDNRGEGHTGYGSSECVHRRIDDFLLYGSLPRSGSSCGAEDQDRL
ncbi:alpha/beta hydrolase [Streptomyces virens]|uniref:Pimeloyl-ACP methyl ester carboxylesterase n=2 Tax=Streptomyces TaxID=1883 RepID=A0AA40S8G3_9ACTN|nr:MULTISPECIES: alpha/beta fold hydrolase [Streptomyces]MBA8941693.1 pimeloyl-ACP methyl ester carboxylesterase [Streptomyces calvus]MBA8976374.1 pimeloyl-ACP methyl ester carboxylesterase [Streptomyces calvus]MYS29610.1 alpha/beta fold hydrolase [Streptomyces sp. SID7804]GGP62413.1 protease [Streptomyces calvus]